MDSIDKLLAQLKTEYNQTELEKPQPPSTTAKSLSQQSLKSASLIDNLLAEVKADIAEQDAVIELQKQQQLEQLQAKQREALTVRAKDWLDKLDPFSPEGLWFERFAEGYSSKLAAAIEYLQNT